MAKTLEQLLSLSSIIANETKAGANTALRVGGLFSDIIYYLRDLNYADKDDIPSLSGYATEQWVLGKGYATTSDLDNRIDALVNGAPAAYDTLKEIADVLANNINSIDDILTALGTKVSKDDFNTAIANVNNSISALNTELSGKIDLKLDAVTFNELFEKVQLEDGTWAIKAKLGLFSDGFISAKGSNVGGTSSEGGAVTLYQLNDVLADGTQVSGAQNGAVFVYDATIGKWKGVAQSEIVPNLTGYATESWVLSQGFLTEHQDLSDYAKLSDIPVIPITDINKGVTAYGWGDHSKVGYLTTHQSLDGYVNEIATSGNGNAITSASKSGKKITFTKGATYLTGITSKLVTDALGYTPYDAANFTKANIKSTLGISDWALASSKPSYTTKEVAEDTNLYFTDARAVAALKSITDGLSGDISTLEGYFTNGVANSALKLSDNGSYTAWGQTFFTNGKPKSLNGSIIGGNFLIEDRANNPYIRLNQGAKYTGYLQILEDGGVAVGSTSTKSLLVSQDGDVYIHKLHIGNGTIEWDETNKGFKIVGGLYTESYLSTKGANTNGGGSSGGGLITSLYRYADLGKTFSDTNNDTFNAYTINKINADLGSRISVLEGKATNVSFTQSLTSGTQIGSISIDGVAKNIYAPTIPTDDINKGVTAYGWGNHASVGYAMASALSDYQTKITSSNKLDYSLISGVPTKLSQFTNDLGLGSFAYKSSLAFADLTNKPTTISGYGITDAYTKSQVDSALGGYLPKSGGTLTGRLLVTYSPTSPSEGMIAIESSSTSKYPTIRFDGNISWGYLGFSAANTPTYFDNSFKPHTLIHSGNIGSQSVANADKLDGLNSTDFVRSYGIVGANYATGNWSGYTYATAEHSGAAAGGIISFGLGSDYCQINGRASTSNMGLYYRVYSGGWSNWKTIAFTDSNVASATKLQTARSIWGQSFDGTANVSGYAMGLGGAIDFQFTDEINRYGGNLYIQHRGDGSQTGTGSGATGNVVMCKNGGNVLIGTSTDSGYKLDVSGNAYFNSYVAIANNNGLYFKDNSGTIRSQLYIDQYNNTSIGYGAAQTGGNTSIYGTDIVFHSSADRTERVRILSNGNVGIGTTSPQYKLDVRGVIYSNTGIFSDGYVSAKGQNTSSDMRLKNLLNEVVLSVKDIANAPSMRFAWKNDGGVDVGSSAQYWQGLLPDAVKERGGMLEMQYANIALLSAIAIAKNVETHEERIARLEKENKELRNEINSLRYGA